MAYTTKIVQEPLEIEGSWNATIVESPDDVTYVQYSELHEFLLAGYADAAVRVFDTELHCTSELTDSDVKVSGVSVTCLKHRPVSKNYPITNSLICSYTNGVVKCWNYNYKECIFTLIENRITTSIAYHPKLAKFLTTGDNKKIYMYDEDSKRQERVLSASDSVNATDGHTNTVTAAAFHPRNGTELISGGLDQTIQFWDTRQPHASKKIEGVLIKGEGLDFNAAGTQFVTCSYEKQKPLRLWDYGTCKEIKVIDFEGAKSMLNTGKYINKTNFIYGAAEPNMVRIVDMSTYRSVSAITKLPKGVSNFTLGPVQGNEIPKYAFSSGKKIYEITPK